jgi:Anti-sigma factor NepR
MVEKTLGRPRKRTGKAKARSAASPRGASAAMRQYIAGRLKAMYDDAVAEPIPERLLQLLDRLSSEEEN